MADKYTSLNETESKILHVIAVHQPAYGTKIKELTGLPSGTIYTALSKMKAKGLVVATHEDGESREHRGGGGPARVFYELPVDILDYFPAFRFLLKGN